MLNALFFIISINVASTQPFGGGLGSFTSCPPCAFACPANMVCRCGQCQPFGPTDLTSGCDNRLCAVILCSPGTICKCGKCESQGPSVIGSASADLSAQIFPPPLRCSYTTCTECRAHPECAWHTTGQCLPFCRPDGTCLTASQSCPGGPVIGPIATASADFDLQVIPKCPYTTCPECRAHPECAWHTTGQCLPYCKPDGTCLTAAQRCPMQRPDVPSATVSADLTLRVPDIVICPFNTCQQCRAVGCAWHTTGECLRNCKTDGTCLTISQMCPIRLTDLVVNTDLAQVGPVVRSCSFATCQDCRDHGCAWHTTGVCLSYCRTDGTCLTASQTCGIKFPDITVNADVNAQVMQPAWRECLFHSCQDCRDHGCAWHTTGICLPFCRTDGTCLTVSQTCPTRLPDIAVNADLNAQVSIPRCSFSTCQDCRSHGCAWHTTGQCLPFCRTDGTCLGVSQTCPGGPVIGTIDTGDTVPCGNTRCPVSQGCGNPSCSCCGFCSQQVCGPVTAAAVGEVSASSAFTANDVPCGKVRCPVSLGCGNPSCSCCGICTRQNCPPSTVVGATDLTAATQQGCDVGEEWDAVEKKCVAVSCSAPRACRLNELCEYSQTFCVRSPCPQFICKPKAVTAPSG